MSHDMSRSAIENGPDVEETGTYGIDAPGPDDEGAPFIVCPHCDGNRVVEDDRGREYRCRPCHGEGVIEADR